MTGPHAISILQSTPRPRQCGVTDSSLALQRSLRSMGSDCEILVDSRDKDLPAGFRRIATPGRLSEARGALIAQISMYGYQSRGLPLHLLAMLRDFAGRGGNTVVACFHETWASARSPLRSAFWLSWAQRRLCRELLRLSSLALFNSPITHSWGASVLGDARARFCPTFSNVGEPGAVTPWKERSDSLVVFGLPRSRVSCYASPPLLETFMARHGIREILDIGPRMGAEAESGLRELPVRFLGPLPEDQVGSHLQSARFGLFPTPWGLASKSGVFAAYRSHGVVPVSIHRLPDFAYQGEPGPVLNRDFVRLADDARLPAAHFQAIADGVFCRYREHSIDATAAAILRFIRSREGACRD